MSPPSASGRSARSRSRELSPYSARRALTLSLDNRNSGREPSRQNNRNRSQDRDSKSSWNVRENSPGRKPRSSLKEASPMDVDNVTKNDRARSPEPYRKPRERSEDRRRDASRDRRRDGSQERHRDRTHEKRRERSNERRRDRSRDRGRDSTREKSEGHPHEKKRDHSKDKRRTSKDRARDHSRDRERHHDRSRERHRNDSNDRRKDRSRDRHRNRSRDKKRTHSRDRRRSRSPKRRRNHSRSRSRSPKPHSRSSKPLPSQEISFRGLDNSKEPPTAYGGSSAAQKPNFKTTGLLAKEANTVAGTKISLKYHEPPEARKPSQSQPWTLFVFDGDEAIGQVELGAQSCWLIGRAREVVDIPLEHASASGQHAAIQFRYISKVVEDEYGVRKERGRVKPYVIDLESSNGTELNDEDIEKGRYIELRHKDVLRFGASEREYVVMLPKD